MVSEYVGNVSSTELDSTGWESGVARSHPKFSMGDYFADEKVAEKTDESGEVSMGPLLLLQDTYVGKFGLVCNLLYFSCYTEA